MAGRGRFPRPLQPEPVVSALVDAATARPIQPLALWAGDLNPHYNPGAAGVFLTDATLYIIPTAVTHDFEAAAVVIPCRLKTGAPSLRMCVYAAAWPQAIGEAPRTRLLGEWDSGILPLSPAGAGGGHYRFPLAARARARALPAGHYLFTLAVTLNGGSFSPYLSQFSGATLVGVGATTAPPSALPNWHTGGVVVNLPTFGLLSSFGAWMM